MHILDEYYHVGNATAVTYKFQREIWFSFIHLKYE